MRISLSNYILGLLIGLPVAIGGLYTAYKLFKPIVYDIDQFKNEIIKSNLRKVYLKDNKAWYYRRFGNNPRRPIIFKYLAKGINKEKFLDLAKVNNIQVNTNPSFYDWHKSNIIALFIGILSFILLIGISLRYWFYIG